jgi:DNA-binding NarL/FixJ family response regulator
MASGYGEADSDSRPARTCAPRLRPSRASAQNPGPTVRDKNWPRAERGDRTLADELTPQEVQVATLVASGSSNKDTAARLFVSPRTIDAHLAHIYRKLDIHSRDDLAAALGARGITQSG